MPNRLTNQGSIASQKQLDCRTSAGNDGKLRSLLCLDTADGKIRWQKSIPAESARIRADRSLASSTPTTDGKAVYVSFWDGKDILVSAYDFQGDTLWSKSLGSFNSQHGAGASPILYRDKLILANDMDKDDFTTKVPNARPSTLVALDKRTGRLLWEAPRVAAGGSGTFTIYKNNSVCPRRSLPALSGPAR